MKDIIQNCGLVGRRIRIDIKDPEDERTKANNPDYNPFEAVVHGEVIGYIKDYDNIRLFYEVKLDEPLRVPGIKEDVKKVILLPPVIEPPVEDYIVREINKKGRVGIGVAYNAGDESVLKLRITPEVYKKYFKTIGTSTSIISLAD